MKYIKIILLILISSCLQESNDVKYMKVELDQDSLSALIQIKNDKAILYNGLEKIELKRRDSKSKDIRVYEFPFYDSSLHIGQDRSFWRRVYKGKTRDLPLKFINKKNIKYNDPNESILKERRYQLEDGRILIINEHKSFYSSTILSNLGDYRYISTLNKDFPLKFSGFDGAYALSFEINNLATPEKIKISWPTTTEHIKLKTTLNSLPTDSDKETRINGELNFIAEDLNQNTFELKKSKKRPKIIQIFGSWCPNCIDEAKFLQDWYVNNKSNSNIEILTLCFERTENKKDAIKSILKVKKHFNLNHTFLLASYQSKKNVHDVLPMLENFKAFPTMIFLNDKNEVYYIHTGFSGPATGKLYQEFKEKFNTLVHKISN